jgi:hypothetical protein
MADSFEELVDSVPPEAGLADEARAELVVLARSADRESSRADAGETTHELGATMARFLLRFTEVVGFGRPETVRKIVEELQVSIDEADARALEEFRRGLDVP